MGVEGEGSGLRPYPRLCWGEAPHVPQDSVERLKPSVGIFLEMRNFAFSPKDLKNDGKKRSASMNGRSIDQNGELNGTPMFRDNIPVKTTFGNNVIDEVRSKCVPKY